MSEGESIFDPGLLAGEQAGGPAEPAAELEFENTLRPRTLGVFVGQELVVGNVRIALHAAR